MKFLRYFGYLLLVLGAGYLVGPKPTFSTPKPLADPKAIELSGLATFVSAQEAAVSLKADNQARIIWAGDSTKQTEYAVVYLHGFSATQEEGNPLHRDFAARYGYHLYLARLPMHGETNPDAFAEMSPQALIDGAKQAIEIGKKLGKKVIVMGCSTGATLAITLAPQDPDIAALLLYSPNIEIANPASELLTGPWGEQLARTVSGGDYHKWDATPAQQAYWSTSYHIEGLAAIKGLVESTMTKSAFEAVKQPVFMAYYYKNEEEQDQVVSVKDMLPFFEQLGTPVAQKRKMVFPNAGVHVICGKLFSKDLEGVRNETYKYAEEILGLVPMPYK
jgi:pimeloyl-ACP methyl ester carboxylesterase